MTNGNLINDKSCDKKLKIARENVFIFNQTNKLKKIFIQFYQK